MTFSPLLGCFSAFLEVFCGVETPERASVVCVWQGKRKLPPQPSFGSLRTAFRVNANRERLDRGADTPDFSIFTKKVEIPLSYPLEPSLPGLRTAFGSISVRRQPERGCGEIWEKGWKKGSGKLFLGEKERKSRVGRLGRERWR